MILGKKLCDFGKKHDDFGKKHDDFGKKIVQLLAKLGKFTF